MGTGDQIASYIRTVFADWTEIGIAITGVFIIQTKHNIQMILFLNQTIHF